MSRRGREGPAWPLTGQIAWRYLRGRRSRLLHRTALSALLSISLGVGALVIAMALMSGYRAEIESKILGENAAILVYPLGGEEPLEPRVAKDRLEALEGIAAVRTTAYGQATLATTAGSSEAVTLRGVDPGRGAMSARAEQLEGEAEGPRGVVLGRELARRLEVEDGALLRLTLLAFSHGQPQFRFRSLRVRGVFETGFAEFDQRWALIDRQWLEDEMGLSGGNRIFEIELEDPRQVDRWLDPIRATLGPDYLITDWRDLNQPLFAALSLQKTTLFFLLGLIVVVSTFNVASTLMVLVRERMRDVGVLTALGMPRSSLRRIFVVYGVALGLVGTGLGVAFGALVSTVNTRFELIRFEPEVAEIYFIDAVHFDLVAADLLQIVAFSLLVTVLACIGPARKAARVQPGDALRYE